MQEKTNFASYPKGAAFSSVGAPPFSEDIANDLVKKALATKERLLRATKSIEGALPTTRRNRHDSMQREKKFSHTVNFSQAHPAGTRARPLTTVVPIFARS